MVIVIAGAFSQVSKERVLSSFPPQWTVVITPPEEITQHLSQAQVLIPEHLPVGKALLDCAPALRMVQTGAGYDNVDVAACTRRGILVCRAAGINAGAVAEHVMALLLSWYKNIPALSHAMACGGGHAPAYTGGELRGKTAGIVGLGAVGRLTAGYCAAFGMRVLGCHSHPIDLPGVVPVSFQTLCAESDFISIHVPLTQNTHHLFDRTAFSAMKQDALLINTARGGVVDEEALVDALRRREIGGACLDVFETEPLPADHPLRTMPNVILTPHTAGLPDGPGFHQARYDFFRDNIQKFARGETPSGTV